jgi:probable F420-dependent oxidoreductase
MPADGPVADGSATDRVRAAKHWGFLMPGTAAAISTEVARQEALGVAGVMVPQIFAPPWAALGVAAASGDVELATGIAMGFVRSPLETAMAALDLDKISGGRFTLGLGTSVKEWNEDRFGVPYDRPLARLRELTTLVRRLTTASEQSEIGLFEGDFYRVDLRGARLPRPVRPSIPIWLAPLRSPMIELSAEVADGLLGHPVWSPRWIKGEVQDAVARGLARSGRSREHFRIVAFLRVAISDDVDQATQDAKAGVPMYAQIAQYASYFAAHGFADEAGALSSLAASGAPYRDLAGAITDEMAREFVIVGTPEEAAEQIADLLPYVDELCLTAPTALPPDRTREYEAAIAQHLLPLGG